MRVSVCAEWFGVAKWVKGGGKGGEQLGQLLAKHTHTHGHAHLRKQAHPHIGKLKCSSDACPTKYATQLG